MEISDSTCGINLQYKNLGGEILLSWGEGIHFPQSDQLRFERILNIVIPLPQQVRRALTGLPGVDMQADTLGKFYISQIENIGYILSVKGIHSIVNDFCSSRGNNTLRVGLLTDRDKKE